MTPETIEKLVLGIILFAITSVVAYLFRMRQLYVATSKLYQHASIASNGSLCELIIYNKGNQSEEQIQLSINQDLELELLASSSSGVNLDKSVLTVDRLHKGCEATALVLVENGALDSTKMIELSSKATKGLVCKSIKEVPPNGALSFLTVVFVVGLVPGVIYSTKVYDRWREAYVTRQLQEITESGWSNLETYYDSDFRDSYSNEEFPIRFGARFTDESKITHLDFDIYNKSALPIYVSGAPANNDDIFSGFRAGTEVPAMSKGKLRLRESPPDSAGRPAKLFFVIRSGKEFIYDLTLQQK